MRFDYLTWLFRRVNSFILAVCIFLIPFARFKKTIHFEADHSADKTNYTFVLIHGFMSWNEDADKNAYGGLPYWGTFSGDALAAYREAGFKCVAPMLDPVGSNWHRVCELYAKLIGSRVDYGKAHSAECGHERYGADYTGKAMLSQWDSEHKINLIGHSLGGKDAILLTSLLKQGSKTEQAATTDGSLSGLFTGGKAEWVYSCTGLGAVYNGTTLFVNHQAVKDTGAYMKEQLDTIKLLPKGTRKQLNGFVESATSLLEKITSGTVAQPDTAIYDMQPDNAIAMNKDIVMAENVYYFSHVQDCSKLDRNGIIKTDFSVTDPIIGILPSMIGRTNTVTPGGLVLGKEWQASDGCANVISQISPFGEPTKNLTGAPSAAVADQAIKGVYNVFPTVRASHLWPTGDFFRPQKQGPTYLLHLMEMINAL